MEIGARAAAAKIAAEANALAKENIDLNRKQALLQKLNNDYNALTMQFGSIGTSDVQVQALLRQANDLQQEYNDTKDPELMREIVNIQRVEIPRVLGNIPEIKKIADLITLIEKQVYGTGD
jgi:archaellum biogenesis protein FlaJ (TadC family)